MKYNLTEINIPNQIGEIDLECGITGKIPCTTGKVCMRK